MRGAVAVTALAACLALPGGCRRDWEPSGPSEPLARDRVMGRYAEQVGPHWRSVTFDGAGGATYTMPGSDGGLVPYHGRYRVTGDTVRAEFEIPARSRRGAPDRFALVAVLRGDSLITCMPRDIDIRLFPPMVRVRPDESSSSVGSRQAFSPCYYP